MNAKCKIGSRQDFLSGALNHLFLQGHRFDSQPVSKFSLITFSLKQIASLSITIEVFLYCICFSCNGIKLFYVATFYIVN